MQSSPTDRRAARHGLRGRRRALLLDDVSVPAGDLDVFADLDVIEVVCAAHFADQPGWRWLSGRSPAVCHVGPDGPVTALGVDEVPMSRSQLRL
jgi:hypothetical protein